VPALAAALGGYFVVANLERRFSKGRRSAAG
jgi:hypothetical protein